VLAQRGHKLLKDKLDGLVQRFLGFSKRYQQLRDDLEQKLKRNFTQMLLSTSYLPREMVEALALSPENHISVTEKRKNVMGVYVPKYEIKDEKFSPSYGFLTTPLGFTENLNEFRKLLKDLLELASLNKTIELIAKEIATIRRRVNALEYVLIPELEATVKEIKGKLDERELSTRVSLFKIKDLVTAKK
jgi:V/A-type H+-transporting ATPase subunit D